MCTGRFEGWIQARGHGSLIPVGAMAMVRNMENLWYHYGALSVGIRVFLLVHDCSNEAEVGSAVRKSDIPRDEVYITTKVGGFASAHVMVGCSMKSGNHTL